ncbi:MAG: NAD-dependent epimerase/dehydratase family protein, partial [Spirochaetaceae bacterium]
MRILVTGGSGFIGTALVARLQSLGHEVLVLTRDLNRVAPGIEAASWDPAAGKIQRDVLSGVEAVIHLAGAGIADKRWSASRRAAILNSRVDSTQLLVSAMRESERPPRVFLSASATGFYGDTGEDICDETSRSGEGFAAEVCRAWEAAAATAGSPGGVAEAAAATDDAAGASA